MWQLLGHDNSLAYETWPEYDESKTKDSEITYVVSINGKVRDKILVDAEASKEEVEAKAFASEKVKQFTDGHTIVKVIVVPKKIVNIVIK